MEPLNPFGIFGSVNEETSQGWIVESVLDDIRPFIVFGRFFICYLCYFSAPAKESSSRPVG